jgi:hypothetical protein
MPTTLDPKAEQQAVDYFVANWDATQTQGYDPADDDDTDYSDYLAMATSIDDVGAYYPSVVVTASNEPPPSPTGYEFISPTGPGATPTGQVVATVRVEQRGADTYNETDAEALAEAIAAHIDTLVMESAHAPPGTDFQWWSAYPANPPADDRGEGDTTFLEQRAISYSYTKTPPTP